MFFHKIFVIFCGIIFTSFLNADNILHLPSQKVRNTTQKSHKVQDYSKNSASKSLALQIQTLEKNNKNFDEYTTKYFKRRVDYSAPFSSEAKDFQDSILIERERKKPKKHIKSAKKRLDSIKANESQGNESKSDSIKSKSNESNAFVDSTIAQFVLPQPFSLPHKKGRDLGESKSDSSDSNESNADFVLESKGDANESATDSNAFSKPDSTLESQKIPQNPPQIYEKLLDSHKPKVVIIIDDIATSAQLSEIESFHKSGLKLTPSIFPVAQGNTQMLERVANLEFFMVHLPLEALAYKDELDTISIYDSQESISRKIARIKRILPNASYINNHTGSKFTERKANMEVLLSVLDSHNINFVDSRTTANTALPSIAQEQNRLILYRDIFIDNALDSYSLNTQINEGVKIAKARGYAILIAHPHKETLNAIRAAQNGALSEVQVVYLNELDSLLKNANITQYAQILKQK